MLLTALTIAAAGLSAVSQAFLLPPDVSAADIEIIDILPAEVAATVGKQHLQLECANCPSLSGERKHHNKDGKSHQHGSHLSLDFAIDHAESQPDALMINGFEVYPNFMPSRDNILVATQTEDKWISQHRKEHKDKKFKEHGDGKTVATHHKHRMPKTVERPLGFSLQLEPATAQEGDMMELMTIDLQVMQVGGIFVGGIPGVRISLVKNNSNGNLMIAKIEQTPAQPTLVPVDCDTMLCRLQAMLDRVKGVGRSGGCMRGHGRPSLEAGQNDLPHRGHNGKHHSWGLLLKKLTLHVLIPVLIGIVAGVSVSIIGMIIGTLIVGLWRVVVRGQSFCPRRRSRSNSGSGRGRRSRGNSLRKESQKEVAQQADEKAALMAADEVVAEEAPPVYVQEDEEEATMVDDAEQARPVPARPALEDYQIQLMLLEQQNKRRLAMQRAAQDAAPAPAPVPTCVQEETVIRGPEHLGNDVSQAWPRSNKPLMQDYQTMLMVLEQQNKQRLMMARQAQEAASAPEPTPQTRSSSGTRAEQNDG